MAWSSETITVNGEEVVAQVHSAGGLVTLPFIAGVDMGSSIKLGGKEQKIAKVVNVGNRDETLDVFLVESAPKASKSKKRKQGDAP